MPGHKSIKINNFALTLTGLARYLTAWCMFYMPNALRVKSRQKSMKKHNKKMLNNVFSVIFNNFMHFKNFIALYEFVHFMYYMHLWLWLQDQEQETWEPEVSPTRAQCNKTTMWYCPFKKDNIAASFLLFTYTDLNLFYTFAFNNALFPFIQFALLNILKM